MTLMTPAPDPSLIPPPPTESFPVSTVVEFPPPEPPALSPAAVAQLRRTVVGAVAHPTDPHYRGLVAGHNLAVADSPAVVVEAAGEADVRAAVDVARQYGLLLQVRATGHGAVRAQRGGILVLTRRLDEIRVDPVMRTATVGAGVRWGALLTAAAGHGLAPVPTNGAGVGVVGSLLGGGLGPQSRFHGLCSDHVRALRVVGADGHARDVDATSALGRALLGGRDGLGVVTAVTVELAGTTDVWGGELVVAGAAVPNVFRDWMAWVGELPDTTTTSAVLMTMPDLPEVPEPLRGAEAIRLTVCDVAPADADRRILAGPFGPGGSSDGVIVRELGPLSLVDWVQAHGDPSVAMPIWQRGYLLAAGGGVTEALLAAAAPPAPLLGLEIRALGGRLSEAPRHTASVAGADLLVSMLAAPVPALFDTVVPLFARQLGEALRPWRRPGVLLNFHGVAAVDHPLEHPAGTAAQLGDLRAVHDPAGVFAAPVSTTT